jgi:CHAT domain-containing protein
VATWISRSELPRRPLDCPTIVLGATDGGNLFPRLGRLQRAGEEAAGILALHGCGETADTLSGVEAALSTEPSLIQFIGHAIAAPGLGGALLLTSSGQLELVDLEALERWPVAGATLILTACSTASGRPSTTVGRDGPARALLSAGAKSVIADLWPLADTSALDFSQRFHRHLRGGETTTEALRQAQLEMIAEGRPLSAWAGWRVVGAG